MIGRTISHYTILEKLGEGGMGVVYKAEDIKLRRHVAIKFLPKALSVHGEERDRFALEAQAASALNHPNVAVIYEIDEADGETFIVMEFVDGKTLREAGAGLPVKKVTDIGLQIAEGLAAAHDKGIVHRDVKAENIMLRKDGRVQVMDFGLAKLRGVSKLTKMGSTIGTIGYMSPEQVQGVETDHRTDIFSLGVVLYELLAGQLPFKGGHEAAVMYEIVNVHPAPVSAVRKDVEPELERIIQKCLEKERDERYQSMKDVALDLKHFKRDSQGRRIERSAPAQPAAEGPPLPAGPRGGLAGGRSRKGLIVAAVVLVTAAIALWRFLQPPADIPQNIVFKPVQLPFTTVWYPGFSSDGNWIAFPATDAWNVTELYYMHVSGGEPKKLTNDSLWKFVADISPDGSQVVYSRGSSRQAVSFPVGLWTISTLGGPSKKIADNGNAPRWSPDGSSIAFISRGALWIMNADGSNKREVFKDSVGGGRVSLAWSPDGSSIAWLRSFLGPGGIHEEIILRDIATGKERQLTHDGKNIDEVYWMPQGEILFSSNRGGASNLWAIPSGGGTPVQITKGPGPDLGIKASKDGKRVLYMQQAAYGSVMIGDIAGMNARQMTPDDQAVFSPAFSPDGRQIAFLVNDPDPIRPFTALMLVDAESRNRRQVTKGDENIENFAWSPDGKRVAYTVHVDAEIDSAHRIVVTDVPDAAQRSSAGKGRVLQWLRDGASLNVVSNGTSWKVPLQGGAREALAGDSTIALQSPDGLKLAAYDGREGKARLVVRFQDGRVKTLHEGTLDAAVGTLFKWFPDSRSFLYTKDGVLWIAPVESGKPRRYVWNNPDGFTFTDLSPDGRQAVFVRQRMNAKLILIDNYH